MMHHYEAKLKMCLKFPAKAKDLPRFCSTTKVEETKATSVLLTEKKVLLHHQSHLLK